MIWTLLILAVCRTRVTYQPSKWPSSTRVSCSSVSGRPWVRFPSGTQNFSLSHARVIVEKNPSSLFITELKIYYLYYLLHAIVNRGKWLGSPANIKGANKEAKIDVGRSMTVHIFCLALIHYT